MAWVAAAACVGLALVGSGALAADQQPDPLDLLSFVKEAKSGSQPTHRVRSRTRVQLVLVASNRKARSYTVCVKGRGQRKCWTRPLGRYQDINTVTTVAPTRPGAYSVRWRLGKETTSWKLRVVRNG